MVVTIYTNASDVLFEKEKKKVSEAKIKNQKRPGAKKRKGKGSWGLAVRACHTVLGYISEKRLREKKAFLYLETR